MAGLFPVTARKHALPLALIHRTSSTSGSAHTGFRFILEAVKDSFTHIFEALNIWGW